MDGDHERKPGRKCLASLFFFKQKTAYEMKPVGPRLTPEPSVEREIGVIAGGHQENAPSGQSCLKQRSEADTATPHSRIVLASGHRAMMPRRAATGQAPSEAAAVASDASVIAMASPPAEHHGHMRNRRSCFPAPCSSMPMRSRPPPKSPVLIWRSHGSESPPLLTTTPWSRRTPSSSCRIVSGSRQRSLQNRYRRGLGREGGSCTWNRQGVSPERRRPESLARGWSRHKATIRPCLPRRRW